MIPLTMTIFLGNAMSTIVRAPCKNYHGYCLAECVRVLHDTYGQPTIEVRALQGSPWSDASHGGYCPTNTASFYPDQLVVEKLDR